MAEQEREDRGEVWNSLGVRVEGAKEDGGGLCGRGLCGGGLGRSLPSEAWGP